MPRLSGPQKAAVVTSLARFNAPSEVQDEMLETYGVQLEINAICAYDPTRAQGKRLGKALTALFWEQRREATEDLRNEACEHRAFRQRERLKLYRNTRSPLLRLKILADAAKDAGQYWERAQPADDEAARGKLLGLFAALVGPDTYGQPEDEREAHD